MTSYLCVMAKGYNSSSEVQIVGDVGFSSEVENSVGDRPFSRADRTGSGGLQLFHHLCNGLFWFSISGALPDVPEDVPFLSDYF